MTAKSISASSSVGVPSSGCNHESIIPGLDHVQCRNCRRCWPRWHPHYERFLNQPTVAPEQTDCSGVTISEPPQLTPEQTDCSGVTRFEPPPLTPEQTDCSGVTRFEPPPLTPEQTDCSGVTLNPLPLLTPEQTDCSGVTLNPTPELTPEQPHWVETYLPSNRKQYSYYRYMWMRGQTIRHVHIPGGNIKSLLAIARLQEIERAIALGWWPTEIEELIKSWRQKHS